MKNTWLTALTLLVRYLLLAALVAGAMLIVFFVADGFPVEELALWRDRRR